MPVWLIGFVLDLLLKFGLPYIVTFLKRVFHIGVDNQTVQVLEDYSREAKEDEPKARLRARDRLRLLHLKKVD